MWFNKKKSKIVLHCYTNRVDVASLAPIKPATACFPEWWKKLPKTIQTPKNIMPMGSVGMCSGMINLYKHGVILPMWCDFAIELGPKHNPHYRWEYSDKYSNAQEHNAMQFGEFFDPREYQHLKLVSPWLFYCEEDVDFIFMEPTWNVPDFKQYRVLPGNLQFNTNFSNNVNMVFTKTDETSIVHIPAGQPLAHIVARDNREIEIKIHVDELKFLQLHGHNKRFAFVGTQGKRIKALKENNVKCPFSISK